MTGDNKDIEGMDCEHAREMLRKEECIRKFCNELPGERLSQVRVSGKCDKRLGDLLTSVAQILVKKSCRSQG